MPSTPRAGLVPVAECDSCTAYPDAADAVVGADVAGTGAAAAATGRVADTNPDAPRLTDGIEMGSSVVIPAACSDSASPALIDPSTPTASITGPKLVMNTPLY